jgi:hypothetical protein
MHHAPIFQTVKQMIQLFRERYAEDVMAVQQLTFVTDSSMCIKYIINLEQHRDEPNQNIEDCLLLEVVQGNPMHEAWE